MRVSLVFALVLGACAVPRHVAQSIDDAQTTIRLAKEMHARQCAPVQLANAMADLDFARIELLEGDARRAGQHGRAGIGSAEEALRIATPCGSADRDEDTIADIVDRCPDEPEDLDGIEDEDGCRDIEPGGDEDSDGIINIDDDCIDVPEDMDGDRDDDGCPETSEDSDGDGLIDAVDACPEAAEDLDGFEDDDGCPDLDNDGDTVVDRNDACPFDPEDLDGWEDDDGCPEADNDDDGILDVDDRCPDQPGSRDKEGCPVADRDDDGIANDLDDCPDEPETANGYLDEDGCPDTPPKAVVVTKTRVEIKDTIRFETGSARLLPSSFSILDQVAQVLGDAPKMRLRVEGHTDSQGSDATNLTLSQERAVSVRAYLEGKGVTSDRLTAEGKGETQPMDTNRTSDGRAANRRVEFHIIE